MVTFAEEAEHSIHAAIEGKFKNMEGGNEDIATLKKTITALERKLATKNKAEKETADGQGTSEKTNEKTKCGFCGRRHGPICFKKNPELAPEWYKNPRTKGKDGAKKEE
jgi:hypothetical protein